MLTVGALDRKGAVETKWDYLLKMLQESQSSWPLYTDMLEDNRFQIVFVFSLFWDPWLFGFLILFCLCVYLVL